MCIIFVLFVFNFKLILLKKLLIYNMLNSFEIKFYIDKKGF